MRFLATESSRRRDDSQDFLFEGRRSTKLDPSRFIRREISINVTDSCRSNFFSIFLGKKEKEIVFFVVFYDFPPFLKSYEIIKD